MTQKQRIIPWEAREGKNYRYMGNSKELARIRETLTLNEHQYAVLIGALLGDASLIETRGGKSHRLQVIHSEKQRALVDWKYEIFGNFMLSEPRYEVRNRAWRFRTISHSEFTQWHKLFYRDGKKIIPENLSEVLTPLGLAAWYMDDGCNVKSKGKQSGCLLNTQCFTLQEHKKLQILFSRRFRISTTLQRNHGYYRLYIRTKSIRTFSNIIGPYMIPTMMYKLPVAP